MNYSEGTESLMSSCDIGSAFGFDMDASIETEILPIFLRKLTRSVMHLYTAPEVSSFVLRQ